MNGLKHFFDRSKDFGVHYVPGLGPGHLDGDRHARGPPDRHDRRLRRDRRRRQADAADDDPQGRRPRRARWSGPIPTAKPAKGKAVISPQTAYIITDILAGNTDPKTNPFWGEWSITDGGEPPTGRLQDRHDERQPRRPRLRLRRPAQGPEGARHRRRRLDGQQRQHAGHGHPLARLVGAALVADPRRGQRRARRSRPSSSRKGLVDRHGRRVQRATSRGRSPRRRSRRSSSTGTEPTQTDDFHGRSRSTRRAASSGRTAASARRRRSAPSTSADVEAGSRQLAEGRQQLDGASGPRRRAGRRARRAPTPRTSTARASSRSAGAGAGSSPRPSSARSRRRRSAAAVRQPVRAVLPADGPGQPAAEPAAGPAAEEPEALIAVPLGG